MVTQDTIDKLAVAVGKLAIITEGLIAEVPMQSNREALFFDHVRQAKRLIQEVRNDNKSE